MTRNLLVLAMLATAAGFAPAAGTQTAEICVGDRIPADMVIVDSKWVPTRCDGSTDMTPNVLVVESHRDKPAGARMEVCVSSRTPRGWVTESTRFHAARCRADSQPGSIDHNLKVIRKLDDAGEDPVDGEWNDPSSLTGIYSDLRRIDETGDVLGTEVYVLYADDDGRGRYYALVQFAEGVPETPQLVELEVRGANVTFTAYLFGIRMPFRGRFTGESLRGEFDGPIGEVDLPRGRGFWQ